MRHGEGQAQAKSHSVILGKRSEKEKGELHMKKHNVMRVASAMAVVTLLSTSLISGTLAKYTSSAEGSDTARVANWTIKAGTGSDLAAISDANTNSFTFDLFNTAVKDTKTPGGSETDVKASTADETIIAPGTWGYVDLNLKNESEVTATYTIKVKPENAGVPLQYAIEKVTSTTEAATVPTSITSGATAVGWTADGAELDITSTGNTLAVENGSAIYRVYWKWDFEDSQNASRDVDDTTLGIAGTATPKVTATVTATQVD